jgi:hypothetical protein
MERGGSTAQTVVDLHQELAVLPPDDQAMLLAQVAEARNRGETDLTLSALEMPSEM